MGIFNEYLQKPSTNIEHATGNSASCTSFSYIYISYVSYAVVVIHVLHVSEADAYRYQK